MGAKPTTNKVAETARVHAQMLAMNEALMLGSVRQHELTEAADAFDNAFALMV